MSNSVSNTQNPTIAATQTATPANHSSQGSSATVAAGPAQPTARSSYASATKPVIASSGAPPVAVGGSQNAQHGKNSSVSPVNGSSIKPAVPTMPAIVGGGPNGNAGEHAHARKSSVHMKQPAPSAPPPAGIKFGSIAASPAPVHALPVVQGNLNPQIQNPRIASPARSPEPIPTPISGGSKPSGLPTRPDLSFGQVNDGSDYNLQPRPISMPPQSNTMPQAQHLRRESSQSGHGDMNTGMTRAYSQQGGRGRGHPSQHFNPNMVNHSPQPYRSMPHQMGRAIPPPFQSQGPMGRDSSYQQNRSPALTPAAMQQQAQFANPQNMPFYPQQPYAQPGAYGMPAPHDPYQPNYGTGYGLGQSMYYPQAGGVPASPGRHGQAFGQQIPYMPTPYNQPQAQPLSRTSSNISERPPSTVPQPSTPALTNVNHHSHTPTISAVSPAPGSSFERPKKQSKAIVIKNADGEVVDFNKPKSVPSAPVVVSTQPQAPRSPAIVATPTPLQRVPSATDITKAEDSKTAKEKQADFVKQFQETLRLKEAAEKKAKEASEADAKAEAEARIKAKEEADAKVAAEAKAKEEAEAAEKAKAEEERLRQEEEERMEREIAEMEEEERQRDEAEQKYAAEKKRKAEEQKVNAAQQVQQEEERLRKLEREAEEAEQARESESPEQKAEREAKNKTLFAGLKKNTMFGPGALQSEDTDGNSTPAEPIITAPTPPPSAQPRSMSTSKPKPAALKLETNKSIEPAQPTAGMQALKSARFLQVRAELVRYPEGIASPNPALNLGSKSKGRQYDKDFLLQFQEVFKEKPSVDWDMKLKETVGDDPVSARPQSTSTRALAMSGRQPSHTGIGGPIQGRFGVDGKFGSGRGFPGGTGSDRFQNPQNRGSIPNAFPHPVIPGGRGGFSISSMGNRTGSYTNMPSAMSPRAGSNRKPKGSQRGPNKHDAAEAKAMPLTAGQDVKALERSQTGWKPISVTQSPAIQAAATAGHMPPDMVQRKVKAALNKMTPEKFDKISDQVLEIAAQSKDESDGRTLRQIIQLTFEKACDESHWSSMYAKFCSRMLQTMSTDIKDENVRDKYGAPVVGGALFRKYLLNRCQEEFERGWEVNLPDAPEDGKEAQLLSDDYYIAAAAKRKGLGLIQFIGELYKLGMLTLRIMHQCVTKLLDFEGLPDEAAIESLVKLLRTVGATMEAAEAGPKMISMYFDRIENVMNMESLPSRLKFMLLDTVDMRRSNWKSKDVLKGPKTIAEIHQDALAAQQAAEMERTRSNHRGGGGGGRMPMGRGDARSFSGGGMLPPQDTSGRVQMDDLKKLSRGVSGRNLSQAGALGPSMLGSRSGSGRRGLGPGMMAGRGDESGASSRTGTPPVQKEKSGASSTNVFDALAALDNDNDNAGEVSSTPTNTEDASAQADAKPSE